MLGGLDYELLELRLGLGFSRFKFVRLRLGLFGGLMLV